MVAFCRVLSFGEALETRKRAPDGSTPAFKFAVCHTHGVVTRLDPEARADLPVVSAVVKLGNTVST